MKTKIHLNLKVTKIWILYQNTYTTFFSFTNATDKLLWTFFQNHLFLNIHINISSIALVNKLFYYIFH